MKSFIHFVSAALVATSFPFAALAAEDAAGKEKFITKDEFLSKAGKNFDKTDADGDGKITREESREAFEKRKERRKERREERRQERQ